MKQLDYCRSNQAGDRHSDPHARGCGVKGRRRRIHLRGLVVRRAAQVCPMFGKVWAKVFTRNSGHALDIGAALGRDLAIAG